MKKIAIMGAGGFGTALSFILSRAGHDIILWDIEKPLIKHWQKIGYSDRYPYLKNHKFPKNLKLSTEKKISSSDFDFVIISSSTSGIEGTLCCLNHDNKIPLVLIQKGMLPGLISPHDIAKNILPKATVMQFTGAGFAKDLVNCSPAGMIVVHEPKDLAIARSFAALFKGSNIWPTCCSDLFGVNIHNTLRTIASFEQGFVYGYFEKTLKSKPPVSTIAITFSAISQETKLLARYLGATKEIHDIESKIYRIIEADLMLCQSDSSRNFALGHFIGQGYNLAKSEQKVTEGVSECVTNISSICKAVSKKIKKNEFKKRFPYLTAAKALISGKDINGEMIKILKYHEKYLA